MMLGESDIYKLMYIKYWNLRWLVVKANFSGLTETGLQAMGAAVYRMPHADLLFPDMSVYWRSKGVGNVTCHSAVHMLLTFGRWNCRTCDTGVWFFPRRTYLHHFRTFHNCMKLKILDSCGLQLQAEGQLKGSTEMYYNTLSKDVETISIDTGQQLKFPWSFGKN